MTLPLDGILVADFSRVLDGPGSLEHTGEGRRRLVDVLTSKDATMGILAALRARGTMGRSRRAEANLLSGLLGSLGNTHPSIAPYELPQCADGPVASPRRRWRFLRIPRDPAHEQP